MLDSCYIKKVGLVLIVGFFVCLENNSILFYIYEVYICFFVVGILDLVVECVRLLLF